MGFGVRERVKYAKVEKVAGEHIVGIVEVGGRWFRACWSALRGQSLDQDGYTVYRVLESGLGRNEARSKVDGLEL
jgi:hypothetical protein